MIMSCMTTKPVKPDDVYYGIHPEDKPDDEEKIRNEYEEFCKSMGI